MKKKHEEKENLVNTINRLIELIRQDEGGTVDKAVEIISNHRYLLVTKDTIYKWKSGANIPTKGVINVLTDYKNEMEKKIIGKHIL